jgi:hypothetical protein
MLSRPNERPLAWGASLACPHRRQTHGDCPIAASATPMRVMPHGTVEVLLPSPIEQCGQRRISLRGDKAMDMPSGRKPPCVKGAGKRRGSVGRR